MKYRKDTIYQNDLRFGLAFLIVLALLLLSGCDCTAGGDAISGTVCKTDWE